jgi:hypothetical protein
VLSIRPPIAPIPPVDVVVQGAFGPRAGTRVLDLGTLEELIAVVGNTRLIDNRLIQAALLGQRHDPATSAMPRLWPWGHDGGTSL